MQTPDIPRRIATVMAAAILVCLLAFTVAVVAVRERINANAAEDSVRLIAARMNDLQAELAGVTIDYNHHWPDAYDHAMAGDIVWIADNYGVTATVGTLFDGLIMYGGPFEAPAAWIEGGPLEPGPSFLPPQLLDRIVAEVRHQPLGEEVTFDVLVALGDRLVLLSAARLQPLGQARAVRIDGATLPIAILTNHFEVEDLGDIVKALSISDLAFASAPDSNLATVPLNGPDGKFLGTLAWSPPRPGSDLVATMAPVLGLAALAFLALGTVAIALARALVHRLIGGEAEARRLARTDSMTGLPNRAAFNEAIARPARAGERAVVFFDLNGFKRINDSIGHAAGDGVIQALADRLRPLRQADRFLARIGGDEFVFVVSGPECAACAAELARAVEAAVEPPFEVQGHRMSLRVAIGYAVQADKHMPGEDLVRQADLAMYESKRHKTGAVAFNAMIGQAADDAVSVEQALRKVLMEQPTARVSEGTGELFIAYQPIVKIGTRRLVRAEALARWTSPTLGIVPPDCFIPVAEQSGLIVELGRRIFLQICDDLGRHPGLRVSLNVSPLQLMAPTFVADMAAELARRSISPARIEVELTEGVVVEDPPLAAARLRELRAAGFSTALDDFGTGYSSIGYLGEMDFDVVKIDRSFVSGLCASVKRKGRVDAMISLSHSFDLAVVCEGVETKEELNLLRALGCDLAQGYYLDRPMPIGQLIERWIAPLSVRAAVA